MKWEIVIVLVVSVLAASTVWAKDTQNIPWKRIPSINVSDYKDVLRKNVAKKLESTKSYGRCKDSIAACLRKNNKTAKRLARDVFFLMASQTKDAKIDEWIKIRKKMAHPEIYDIRGFDLEGMTPLGNPKAPIVVVEYSDFQCPFCAMVAPILEKIIRKSKGKARLYFKQFPLKSHPHALSASKACVAADAFGKFWEYCPKLFHYQEMLSDELYLRLADELGIDKKKFQAQVGNKKILDRITDEKMEGLKNRVKATPTIFINGKELLLQATAELLLDRIEEELDILNGQD